MNTRDEVRNESVTVTAMGVVEVGVVDTCYGVSQPRADAYRCACLVVYTCTCVNDSIPFTEVGR